MRPGSIIGAIGCLGLLLVEPVTTAVRHTSARHGRAPSDIWPSGTVMVVAHVAILLLCSRLAARFESVAGASLAVLAIFVASTMVLSRQSEPTPLAPKP